MIRRALPALLTDRERCVANLVAEGLGNKQIAARLCLSESTIKTYVERALSKTGARGRVQLARYVWSQSIPWDGS